jgi:hypothetical protein
MKKYKIKLSWIGGSGTVYYAVYRRWMLIFWIRISNEFLSIDEAQLALNNLLEDEKQHSL